jgi:hypothetical protein
MHILTVRDQAIGGGAGHEFSLDFPSERITVRELIKSHIKQEVHAYNKSLTSQPSPVFRGLIQPTDAEIAVNGCRLKTPRTVDWQAQFDRAIEAFEHNQIFVLVNDKQVESLDDQILVNPQTLVSFLRIVPLVGG